MLTISGSNIVSPGKIGAGRFGAPSYRCLGKAWRDSKVERVTVYSTNYHLSLFLGIPYPIRRGPYYIGRVLDIFHRKINFVHLKLQLQISHKFL